VQGSGIFDTFKPVPGTIEAVHYNSGAEGVAYHDLSPGNLGERYIRKDNVDIIDCSEGGFAISNNQVGEWYKYNINVQATRTFNLGLKYAASGSDSKIRIWQGDTDLTGVISLPSTTSSTTWQVYTIKGLNLKAGFQTLKFEIVAGDFDFYNFELALADNTIFTKTDDFTKNFSFDWNYSDGTWSIVSGQAKVSGFAKKTFGSTAWSDYTLQTDITYTDAMNSGLIFRVNNPALGGAGNNPEQGTDFYQGYYVTLNGNSVVLGKQNYSWTLLKTAAGAYRINTKYTIKVEAIGANIKVYVDDMDIPKIDFTDPNPFIHGKVGLRSFNSTVFFDNFSVTTIDDDSPALVESTMVGKEVKLFPNPVKNSFFLDNVDTYSSLSI
jgi:xylan 1,4-beta-xylosidase